MENVAADAPLRICAAHAPEHEQRCAADFSMGSRPAREIELRLPERATLSGKLLTNEPFFGGVIWLVAPTGAILDAGYVSEAGAFTLKRTSVPGAYLVVVSMNHPLAVFDLPAAGGEDALQFEMPAQSRTIAVTLSPRSRQRQIGLEMSGRVVPSQALRRHQSLRRLGDILQPGETIEVRDLAPAPLAVYSLPYITDYPPEWVNLDPLESPQLRIALPRFPVTRAAVAIE